MPISTSPQAQNGTQLCFENFLLRQADAYGAVAQRRVVFLAQAEVVGLLVGADVERADDDLFVGHGFRYALVDGKLFLFARKIVSPKVNELASEQADALRVVLQHKTNV